MNQAMNLSYLGIFKTLLEQNSECDSVFLTGGSSETLLNCIEEIFLDQDIIKEPHLIHHALTYIYQEVSS